MKRAWLFSVVGFLGLCSGTASAEVWAYTNPGPGNQTWTGNLGLDFHVNSAIVVTGLGIFNASGADFIVGGPISVGIFDINAPANSGPLVSASFVNTTAYDINPGPFDLNQAVSAIVLGPGDYSVVAVGFSGDDPNSNQHFGGPGPTTDDGGNLISFIGTGRYDNNVTLDLPGTIDSSNPNPNPSGPNIYNAGTFEFEAAPEPGTVGLLGIGFAAVLGLRRRSKQKAGVSA